MGSRQQGYNTLRNIAGDLLVSQYDQYSNNRTLLTFKCQQCLTLFNTTGFLYTKSNDGKRCVDCKHRLAVTNNDARAACINKWKQKHGDYYDYSKVPATFSAHDKITIICPKHGNFIQSADTHSRGSGCSICKIDNIANVNRSDTTEFVIKANKKHNNKYRYDQVQYINAKTPIDVICNKHGVFSITPDVHLRGSGCVKCSYVSKPINKIIKILDRLSIRYTLEKTFAGCVGIGGRLLRFDIYIPDRNLCIEYDGPHHFKPFAYGKDDIDLNRKFDIQQQHDDIKDKFCSDNNIELVRIPHTEHHPDATVKQLVTKQLTATRYYYSYDMLQQDIIRLSNYIDSFNYSQFAVYGIARGGVAFSIPLSYHYDQVCEYGIVTYQRYDGNSKQVRYDITHQTKDIPIFVIDDLISSGDTMTKVVESLQHKFKKAKIHPIVIFGDQNENNIYFIHEHPKQWIVFPYEV